MRRLALSRGLRLIVVLPSLCLSWPDLARANDQSETAAELLVPGISVVEPRIADGTSFFSYDQPVSALRYDPLVDVQERNLGELQADVSVRGGTFANTAAQIAGVTLFDPQTEHYVTEIPLPPSMLTPPDVRTGSANTLGGFNSTVATLGYEFRPLTPYSRARFGGGDFRTYLTEAAVGLSHDRSGFGFEVNAATSASKGTRPNGDNELTRFASRIQHRGEGSQSDVAIGYQEKDLSWPFLYAPQALHQLVGSSGVETESLHTALLIGSHRLWYDDGSFLEFSGYARRNRDNYDFDRFNPGLFNPFEHTTRVYGGAVRGEHVAWGTKDSDTISLRYQSQLIRDSIDSTALVFGPYTSRQYRRLSLAPTYVRRRESGDLVTAFVGAALDDSNETALYPSPVAGAAYTWQGPTSYRVFLEYATAAQLPTYTALSSNPNAGLFRGNPELDAERTRGVEGGLEVTNGTSSIKSAIFFRDDDSLVDWVYDSTIKPFASRAARNVDLETLGCEVVGRHNFSDIAHLVGGYQYLNRDASYPSGSGDASFYALNFARHRATLGLTLRPIPALRDTLSLVADTEFRVQAPNALRTSSDTTYVLTTASIVLDHLFADNLTARLTVDNLGNENFEEIPGVPGRRRLAVGSVSLTF